MLIFQQEVSDYDCKASGSVWNQKESEIQDSMQIRKAYRYELMPKGEHIRKMKQFCGCARFVFNRALAYQKAQYESDNAVKFSYTRLANLLYKQAWKGGLLVIVPPRNTSRTCPCCGHVSEDNRKTQAEFRCETCGFEGNADEIGAINISRAGHARLACEVNDAVRSPATGTHRRDQSAGALTQ